MALAPMWPSSVNTKTPGKAGLISLCFSLSPSTAQLRLVHFYLADSSSSLPCLKTTIVRLISLEPHSSSLVLQTVGHYSSSHLLNKPL
jgi:hypothetical protein